MIVLALLLMGGALGFSCPGAALPWAPASPSGRRRGRRDRPVGTGVRGGPGFGRGLGNDGRRTGGLRGGLCDPRAAAGARRDARDLTRVPRTAVPDLVPSPGSYV